MSGAHRPDFDQVAAWLREHPTATRQEAATKFGWSFASISANWQALKKPAARTKGAPAKSMSESDRDVALNTVRDSYAILNVLTRQLRGEVERAADKQMTPSLDRDVVNAMLTLQRMAAGMIDAHPGLLEMSRQAEGASAVTEEELLGIVDALEH